ncbi:MAG: HAD-IC family P-type ATPase, partial [Bacteroidota bacterium]
MKYPLDNPHHLPAAVVAAQLETDPAKGLSASEAAHRLRQFGENVIETKRRKPWYLILLAQFVSPLAWVLAVAGGLGFAFGEWMEGIAIIIVLLFNAGIGFWMEWQANRSMDALRKLAQTSGKVYRDGSLKKVNAAEIVPGDLVFLEAGDMPPADGRILEQTNLETKEAALTGESTPVKKQTDPLQGEVGVADRSNMVFKGTVVTAGNAKAIITATAAKTELGNIAQLTGEAEKEATPLEKRLNVLSRKLLWLTLVLTALIFAAGVWQGRELMVMIKTAIALAVAAIPEGLPIVATIALARGMLRLAKHSVIVKKLSAVETLGSTQVIFTDKTGTLTENELSVDTVVFEFGKASFEQAESKADDSKNDRSSSERRGFETPQ